MTSRSNQVDDTKVASPAFERLLQKLTARDPSVPIDLGETLTPRTFAAIVPSGIVAGSVGEGAVALRATLGASPISIPPLGHIALSQPGPNAARRERADIEITGVLGEGGMGRVLLAQQKSLRRSVAVKTLRPDVIDPAAIGSLLVEAVITGSLEHPNVVPVHALGCDDDGRPVLVMKRIDGVSWQTLFEEPAHPAWARFDASGDDRLVAHLDVLMQVANAVDFAHSRGIAHRDIKLANVMIGGFGEVYLVDWGIAVKMGPAGDGAVPAFVGTPVYMAPEMLTGDPAEVDARTDVYLLGATLHVLLAGEPRHGGANIFAVLDAARTSLPVAYGPDVPAELAAICNKATSVDPSDRFQTALELRQAIAGFLRHRGAVALSDSAAGRLAEACELEAGGGDAHLHRTDALLTESRFGFEQSLRAWRDNPAARKGLQHCLERMIEHEIARRDAVGARALYASLPEARPPIAARIEALAGELDALAQREARLRRMDRDLDLSIGSRGRVGIAALLGVVAAGLMVTLPWRHPAAGHGRFVGVMVFINLALFGGVAALRRQLFATAIGRRVVALPLAWAVTNLVGRLMVTRLNIPIPVALTCEMWTSAGLFGFGALVLDRRIAWAALAFGGGALFSLPRPEVAPLVYNAVALAASIVFLWVYGREAKGQTGEP